MAGHDDLLLERTLNAPVALVWEAYTNPEHLKRWFAPRPYEITEVELDLQPGGIFRFRMVGPDGFDTGHGTAGCVLEVVAQKKLTWTSALGPGYRPNGMGEGCEAFPFTAVVTFADAGDGKTAYKPIPKGKIEVIEVIGPNIAQCRIIDEDNAVRDRVISAYQEIMRMPI